jgi:hypothetical protein
LQEINTVLELAVKLRQSLHSPTLKCFNVIRSAYASKVVSHLPL